MKLSVVSSFALLVSAATLPSGTARAQEGPSRLAPSVTQETTTQTTGPRVWMVESGAVVLTFAYMPMVVVGASSRLSADRTLLVPIAGPWIDLAQRPSCAPAPACTSESSTRGLLVVDGVFQGVGALTLLAGLPTSETRTVQLVASPATLRVSPAQLGTRSYGMAAVGTF
jgi:hypothetical protein